MGLKTIPAKVKQQAEEIVKRFNQEKFDGISSYYKLRFKGVYLYIDRWNFGRTGPICRLKYTGQMDAWEFAIYKYSSGTYSPDEFFPGWGFVDGTIEGAMLAGLEAYPG
jgi:hypothetical protein